MNRFAWIPLILLTVSPALRAADELITDRPDQTESSSTVPVGSIQIEVGFTESRNDEGGLRTETRSVPGTLLRVGVKESWELRLEWDGRVEDELRSGAVTTDADGSGDTAIGVKVRLAEERGLLPEIALLFGTSLPTGSNDFSSNGSDPSFRLSLAHTLTDRFSLGYNVGAFWSSELDVSGERDRLASALYTAALGIGINDRLGAFVEVYGDVPLNAVGGPRNSVDGGLTILLRENVQLDLAGGTAISDDADDEFFGIGLTVRLPN